MSASDNPIEDALFPKGTEFDENTVGHLLEQYKLLVQTSETLVTRRQSVHTFFLSVNTLLLTAIGLVTKELSGGVLENSNPLIFVLGLTGVLLAISWHRIIKSYGQLNRGKFTIINLLEKKLPASMFEAEWIALGEGKDKKIYRPFTSAETLIPRIFGLLYIAAMFQSIVGFEKIFKWF